MLNLVAGGRLASSVAQLRAVASSAGHLLLLALLPDDGRRTALVLPTTATPA